MKEYSNTQVWVAYFFGFAVLLSIVLLTQWVSDPPSKVILGTWKEKEWKYEVINTGTMVEGFADNNVKILPEYLQNRIREDVIVHQAETWVFKPGNVLLLEKESGEIIEAEWRLKGRGHILYIRYLDGSFEFYDIKELTEKEMVINFDIGMEVRGVARLTFTRQ
ncbi:MAG: hypothetical protein JJU02_14870 [Cryomorphaceae bacterium]|nr:hypothetical protein [Cryomorphaceae bacterium]